MKFTDKPPTDGTQFIAIWMHNGHAWSGTYKFVHGRLMFYNEATDDFETNDGHNPFDYLSAIFVIPD